MKNDVITKVQTTLTPDGSGGYTEETIELGSFDVKLSIGNNVEEATAYGVSVEQVLKVISTIPLEEDEASLYLLVGPQGKQGPEGKPGPTYSAGNGIEIKDNVISTTGGGSGADVPIATLEVAGKVKPDGTSITVEEDGTIHAIGGGGEGGENGATFTPTVSESGIISWTNDRGLPNPEEVNIKGPQGDPGKDGKEGKPGIQGLPGEPGKDGQNGQPGKDGLNGKDGSDGKSAYQCWIDLGNSGSEQDFINSLKGQPGKDGAAGLPGKDGQNGAPGKDGTPGADGQPGPAGQDGKDYVITEADYSAIADVVLTKLVDAEGVKY